MTQQIRLNTEDTPAELWFEIAHHLGPRDILSLSHICRALHVQISRREVWEAIFRSMCRERALFIPSFGKIDEMSILELIRAALGPHRWSQVLTAHHQRVGKQGGDPEVSSRSALTPLSSTIFPRHGIRFHRQFLVPGGRYLVAYGSAALYLFDLGQVGLKPLEPPLIVAQERPEESDASNTDCTGFEVIGARSDEGRIRVGLAFSGGAARNDRVVVYDIVPNDPSAAFIKICSLSFSPAQGHDSTLSLCGFHLRHNSVYLRYRLTGVVCDFIQGRYCDVPLRPLDEDKGPLAVLFSGDIVGHIYRHSVLVWRVPPKHLFISGSGAVSIPERDFVPPDFILPLPPIPLHDPDLSAVLNVFDPSPWLQNQLGQTDFDFFARLTSPDETPGIITSRYRISGDGQKDNIHLDHQCDHIFPDHYLFLTTQRLNFLTEYTPGTMLPLKTKDFSLEYAYVEPPSCLPGEDPEHSSQLRRTVIQAEDYEIPRLVQDTLLCGASGRSWYSSATGEGVVIRVVDYHSFRSSSLPL